MRGAGNEAAAPTMPVADAYARYEAIRPHLPTAMQGPSPRRADRLMDIASSLEGVLFDSFGVLNVGETAIPGATECLSALRAANIPFCVLTNAASYPRRVALEKYRRMGLNVRDGEVVSSRDVLFAHAAALAPGLRWAAITAANDAFDDATVAVTDLLDGPPDWGWAEGFLFLSSSRWTAPLQDRLVAELLRRPRPVVVGNPDLVAPREGGLSIEPGFYGHDLRERTGVEPRFYGKPYPEAFAAAIACVGVDRPVMIGDTLHTDILGAQALGLDTVLVTRHGLFANEPVERFIAESGITPTWIMPSI